MLLVHAACPGGLRASCPRCAEDEFALVLQYLGFFVEEQKLERLYQKTDVVSCAVLCCAMARAWTRGLCSFCAATVVRGCVVQQ